MRTLPETPGLNAFLCYNRAMSDALLRTKYTLPALRPRLVARQRLDALFEQALHVPLTLISAPPGFGKTTAALTAAHTLRASHAAVAWLALEPDDDEPGRFWRYFAAALQTAAPGVGEAASAALVMPQPIPIQAALGILLNEIAARQTPHFIALDDYHVITLPEIHDGMAFLLDHAPANLHVLLATRADPPLPLHRMRARGQIVEIRAATLRFDRAEAAAFLAEAMALTLSEAELTRLIDQTEGWAAGLQLAGLALQGIAPGQGAAARQDLIERLARNNRYIADYLTEEVLAQQQPPVQAFLLHTAILDRLCGSLCNAVTGGSDGGPMLEALAHRNLFVVPMGAPESDRGRQTWFRYHQLFADLLRGRLRQQSPELIPVLHQRAAGWYEQNGDVEAAIRHALHGEDYERLVRLLETHARAVVMEGRALTVEGWLKRIPEAWYGALPNALVAFAWALLLRGRYAEVEPYVERAEAVIPLDDETLRGEVHALRASLADTLGQVDAALHHARLALASVPPDDRFAQAVAHMTMAGALRATGDAEAAIAAYERAIPLCIAAQLPLPALLGRAHLTFLCIVQGWLHRAEAIARPVLDAPIPHPAAGAVVSSLGSVMLAWNRLDEAEVYLDQAMALARQSGHNATRIITEVSRSQLHRARGDLARSQAALEAAGAVATEGIPAWVAPLLLAERVQLWLALGDVATADQVLAEQEAHIAPAAAHVGEVLPLARASIRYAQRDYAAACALLDEVIQSAQAARRRGRLIEALVLRALAHDAQGAPSLADADLRRALALAEPEGFVRVFLDAGPPLVPVLMRVSGADEDSYARHILDAMSPVIRADAARTPRAAALPEPLTEREVEVLRLMARGLTYQQIADDLVVSINTVRHHVKSVYGKLGASTRTLAIEKARALDLL